ncbi:hypothetical protein AXI58_09960 [Bacillus nakamurai]|uniref:Uncharacterized protein n=2 Tax=Bacillus nakamurai TaxID=1793963 RepID=A0A150FAR3_9BACI|nr:hypothetical protein AXI58_09960 [Bacillus nakamurai]
MQVYKYDENYIYEFPVVLEDDSPLPDHCTTIPPSDGLYIPKFNTKTKKWVESASEEYIDSLKPLDPEPSETEKLKKVVSDVIYQLMMEGVL